MRTASNGSCQCHQINTNAKKNEEIAIEHRCNVVALEQLHDHGEEISSRRLEIIWQSAYGEIVFLKLLSRNITGVLVMIWYYFQQKHSTLTLYSLQDEMMALLY